MGTGLSTAERGFPSASEALSAGPISWAAFLVGLAVLPVWSPLMLVSWLVASIALAAGGLWPLRPGPAGRWLIATALVLLVLTAFSVRPGDSLLGLFNYLPFFLFFGLAVHLVDRAERLTQLLTVLLWGGLVTGLAGLFEWVTGANWQWEPLSGLVLLTVGSRQEAGILDRVTAFFAWPTSTAAYLLLVLPLAAAIALGGLPRQRWLGWAVLAVGGVTLLGTASRNAWMIALLVVGALLLVARRWRLVTALTAGAGTVLLAGLGPVSWPPIRWLREIVPASLWQKVSESITSGTASFTSLTNRLDAWQIALRMTGERPLTGWGLQTFPFVEKTYFGHDAAQLLHAHNLYLTYTAETGIPAALLLVGFYLWTLLRGVRQAVSLRGVSRWQQAGLLAALVAYLLFGFSDVPFYDARINALFWIELALIWRMPSLALQETIKEHS